MTGSAVPRPTLLDVANRAGVSRTTASFVMGGRRDMRISAETEQRVRQAARELNYRPSLLARSLRNNQSQTLALISDVIAAEVFAGEMIRGALTTAQLHDHMVFIGETAGDSAVEKRVIHGMLDRGAGGFIYASIYTRRVRVSQTLRAHPLVLLNCTTAIQTIPTVIPDEREGGRTAARALLQAGHRDGIVLVGEQPRHIHAAGERRFGIDEVLNQQGAQLAANIDTLWWPEPAYQAVREFLSSGHRPTALICLNDRIAMGAYQAAREAGLRIPLDLSVVSFDNSDLAAWMHPEVTSVAIPHFELGQRAVELLLAANKPSGVERISMPLCNRASIAAPAVHRSVRRASNRSAQQQL